MSHRDPQTGQFVATDDEQPDYADFEYQQLNLEVRPGASTTDGAAFVEATAAVEPLEGRGGLANNEVAELVGHRITVAFRAADSAVNGDQDVGGGFYLSGSFGANSDDEALIPENFQSAGSTEVIENQTTSAAPDPVTLASVSQGRIFEVLQSSASLAFDDETNGTGGGQASQSNEYTRNWRNTTGRGPVLDQTDDVTLALRAIAFDSALSTPGFVVQVHLVWDVAELSDAGRVFSVPR